MPKRRETRRLAMQLLYQFDMRGDEDRAAIYETLENGHDPQDVNEAGFQLAQNAWEQRQQADTLIGELAPDWPTHRQPPIDRAILRLAYHEMVSGHAPISVAINEAINLAKEYCTENSPAFINGVLDKIAKQLPSGVNAEQVDTSTGDAWLDDALQDADTQQNNSDN